MIRWFCEYWRLSAAKVGEASDWLDSSASAFSPGGPMPLYFFDTSNARDIADLTGSDCADLAALRERAIRYSCEVLTELPEHFWSGRPLVMTVSDASRLPIFTLRFLAGRPPAGRLPTAIEPGCTSAGAKRALRRSVPMARYYFH